MTPATETSVDTFVSRIAAFASAIQKDQIAYLRRQKLDCESNINNAATKVVPGKKYWKVDMGGSGRYMVEMSTENIYGIKAYGVIHKGHEYGTLSTINQYDWGAYRGTKRTTSSNL